MVSAQTLKIVVAASVIHAITDGIILSVGIVFSSYVSYFNRTVGTTASIPSIANGMTYIYSPITFTLSQFFGCRLVAVAGGVVIFLSLCTTFFLSSFALVNIVFGLIFTLGHSLSTAATLMVLQTQLPHKAGVWVAFSFSGSGVGQLLMPLFMGRWVDTYDWQGCNLLAGAVAANIIAAALMFDDDSKTCSDVKQTILAHKNDLSVQPLLVPGYLLFVFASGLAVMTQSIPLTFLDDHVKEQGLNLRTNLAYTVVGVMGVISEIVAGSLLEKGWLKPWMLFSLWNMISGSSCFLLWFPARVWSIMLFAVCYGFGMSFTYVITLSIVAQLIAIEDRFLAFGALECFQGICAIIGGPVAGILRDKVGNYKPAFILTGIVLNLSAVTMFLWPFLVINLNQTDSMPTSMTPDHSSSTNGTGLNDGFDSIALSVNHSSISLASARRATASVVFCVAAVKRVGSPQRCSTV